MCKNAEAQLIDERDARPHKKGGLDVDIHVFLPNGRLHHERRKFAKCSRWILETWRKRLKVRNGTR